MGRDSSKVRSDEGPSGRSDAASQAEHGCSHNPAPQAVDQVRRARPIIFSGASIRALLAGRKTQTRRLRGLKLFNVDPGAWYDVHEVCPGSWQFRWNGTGQVPEGLPVNGKGLALAIRCPYGKPGDRLRVKEAMHQEFTTSDKDTPNGCLAIYSADDEVVMRDGKPAEYEWERTSLSPICMPRWASRLWPEVTEVRVQRVQDISEDDAIAEGCNAPLLAKLIKSLAAKADPLPMYCDDGCSWCGCWQCAKKHKEFENIDGGWPSEEDGPRWCEDCGKLLDFTLTDEGCQAEWETEPLPIRTPDEAWVMRRAIGADGYPMLGESSGDFTSFPGLKGKVARQCYCTLWDSHHAKPKPVYGRVNGKRVIQSYVSYPWEDIHEEREHRGLPWRVFGNCWIWAITYKLDSKEARP